MRAVRLYPDAWSVLHASRAAARSPGCRRCGLAEDAGPGGVGIDADGRPGGLLVLGLSARGTQRRPFNSRDEAVLRGVVASSWSGPVAYDSALRCAVDRGTRVGLAQYREEVARCRPHTLEVLDDVRPTRIVAFGSHAADSLLGVTYGEPGGRRVYGWVPVGPDLVPCFVLRSAETCRDNVHHERWTSEDLKWALSVDPAKLPPPQFDASYSRCESLQDVADAVDALVAHGRLAHDVETVGRMHDPGFRVFCLGLATTERRPRAWIVPDHLLKREDVRAELRRLYLDADVELTGHNNKYDVSAMCVTLGIPAVRCVLGDTGLQRKLEEVDVLGRLDVATLRVGMAGHKDEAKASKAWTRTFLLAARRHVEKDRNAAQRDATYAASVRDDRYDDWALEECLRSGTPYSPAGCREGRRLLVDDWREAALSADDANAWTYGLAARGTIETYCARDAVATALLDLRESAEVEAHPVFGPTYQRLVRPAVRVVGQMERWGVPVDRQALFAFATVLEVEIEAARFECRRWGLDDPGSDDKVRVLLFKDLRLPVGRLTDKDRKPSVDDEQLVKLLGSHPVVAAIRQHRQLQKLLGTYATGLLRHVRTDGRVHPNFRIAGTETGRMSCADPNLQTIPSRGKWAKLAKSVFAPRPGRVFIQWDYNQMELRVAAHLSGDPGMLDIYSRGLDYHAETALFVAPIVWRAQYRKLTKEEAAADPALAQAMDDMRRAAKVVNFGLIYGKGDQSLAEEAQISVAVATQVREAILGRFNVLDAHIKDHVNFCRRNGFTRTFHDGRVARLRALPDISSRSREYSGHAERAAWNTPVQGSASDYLLASLARSVDYVLGSGMDATLDLQVHDSILGECWEDDADELEAAVRDIMLDFRTRCPLVVDTKRGRSWGELE